MIYTFHNHMYAYNKTPKTKQDFPIYALLFPNLLKILQENLFSAVLTVKKSRNELNRKKHKKMPLN